MKKILNYSIHIIIIIYSVEILFFVFSTDIEKSLVNIKNKRIEIAKMKQLNFDSREPEEVFIDMKKKNPNLGVPFYYSSLFENFEVFKEAKKNKNIIPFRGPINKKTLSCAEDLNYKTINNDRYGFKNPDYIYNNEIDVILLGGSFTEGYCYNIDKDIAGNLNLENISTLNLGVAATGPLVSLAVLKEFGSTYKPKNIFYLYYEGNNLDMLEWEKKDLNLIKYLNKNYKNYYLDQYDEIKTFLDKAEKESLEQINNKFLIIQQINKLKKNNYIGSIKDILELTILKNRIRNLFNTKKKNYDLKILNNIIVEMQNESKKWKGNFTFVYLPSWERYFNKNSNIQPVIKLRNEIIRNLEKNNIQVIDITNSFSNLQNLKDFYPLGYIGHVNEKGYKKIADILKESILN